MSQASPSSLYPAVFHFLGECGFMTAHRKFGKQAKLLSGDDEEREPTAPSPTLMEIYQAYLQHAPGAQRPKSSKAESPPKPTAHVKKDILPKKREQSGKPRALPDEKQSGEGMDEASLEKAADEDGEIAAKKPSAGVDDIPSSSGKKRKARNVEPAETTEEPPVKKRKRTEDEQQPGASQRFKRIDPTQVKIDHSRLADNSYFAHAHATGESWGLKAAKDLAIVQGDRFRHEKTKKKRGSYKGGEISFGVNSVKLDSEDSLE